MNHTVVRALVSFASLVSFAAIVGACGGEPAPRPTVPALAVKAATVQPKKAQPITVAIAVHTPPGVAAPIVTLPDCECGPCSQRQDGAMFCAGTGFKTCAKGTAIYRDCAPGTACRETGESIVCDWPAGN